MTSHPSHDSLVSLFEVVLFDIQRACVENKLLFQVRFNSELF